MGEGEHDLGYKSDFGIPRQIRRNFARLAGLLELADKQFLNIREDATAYNKCIHDRIQNNDCDDILLDSHSFYEYVAHNRLLLNFFKKVREEAGVDVELIEPENLLSQLEWFHMDKLGELSELITNNSDYALNRIMRIKEDIELDIMTSNSVIRLFFEGELVRTQETKERMKSYFRTYISDENKIERNISRIRIG